MRTKTENKKDYTYTSGLSKPIMDFIDEKHKLGYKYIRSTLALQNLDRFCLNFDCKEELSEEIVLAWTKRQPNQSAKTVNMKIGIIRELAQFMQRNGYKAYILPKVLWQKETHEHTPYIFSHDEISRLFYEIDGIKYNSLSPKRYLIYPLMFRFLYCCGLRASEALNLKLGQIDLNNGTLMITNAKDYRDRLIPLNQELLLHCKIYTEQMFTNPDPEQYFFPAPDGTPYHIFTVRKLFRKLMWQAGISYGGRNKGPRLHDLRHTFAVRCLEQFLNDDKELHAVIPVIATYMGHKSYKSTSRYIHLAVEMFPDIIEKSENEYSYLFPESEDNL